MKHLLFILLLISAKAYAQNIDDRKIIITVTDTSNLSSKVKTALVKNEFIVKELPNKDTLLTYPNEFSVLPGYTIIQSTINNNQVSISGGYSLKRINDFGYTVKPKGYRPIVYFKGSKGWKLLEKIANDIGGQLSYSK